jgi:hypothetical protein
VEVILTPDAVARAGIATAKVTATEPSMFVQAPGTVMANAYREVKVTPIAGGIVTRVHVELGAAVKRGDPVMTLFSADLADAQTKYLSMSAMLEADHQKRERTRQLVEIGAANLHLAKHVGDVIRTGHIGTHEDTIGPAFADLRERLFRGRLRAQCRGDRNGGTETRRRRPGGTGIGRRARRQRHVPSPAHCT